MPHLYYWRGDNYRRDLDYGAGYHLNQANPLLHEVELGDSLWAFTRTPDRRYVLAAELVVRAQTRNPPGFRYGPYRLWGDLTRSRYFQTDGQPDITTLVLGLSVRADAAVLGRSFQGRAAVRRLSVEDHQVLTEYARPLPLEPRARLVPEERLEAILLLGDPQGVETLLQAEEPGLADERRRYLYQQAVTRNRGHVERLRDLYDGRCQLCGWDPRGRYGEHLCEGHHVRWLSRGGADEPENMVLACPNHHREIHRTDAPFDWTDSTFLFPRGREPLLLTEHQLAQED